MFESKPKSLPVSAVTRENKNKTTIYANTKDIAELAIRPNLLSVFSFLLLDELNDQCLDCKNIISVCSLTGRKFA